MDVQAIVFDKDGTFMKSDSFWVEVSRCAVRDILRQLNRNDIPMSRLLGALGISGDSADIDGLLCKGAYEQIALAIGEILREFGVDISDTDIVKMTVSAYNGNAGSSVIGVGETTSSRERLMPYTDTVIPDISYLPDVMEEE